MNIRVDPILAKTTLTPYGITAGNAISAVQKSEHREQWDVGAGLQLKFYLRRTPQGDPRHALIVFGEMAKADFIVSGAFKIPIHIWNALPQQTPVNAAKAFIEIVGIPLTICGVTKKFFDFETFAVPDARIPDQITKMVSFERSLAGFSSIRLRMMPPTTGGNLLQCAFTFVVDRAAYLELLKV